MSKGFLWFAQNNDKTDYVELSIRLAKSIKKHNSQNKICVITDEKSKFENEYVDLVKVLKQDESADHEVKWANEYKAFSITPFTHTIKLESDLLWTINTDWWWHHLGQHDLVFSVNCFDYRSNVVKDTIYRKLFTRNQLPNIYNGLMYFRKSEKAKKFFNIVENLVKNWTMVRSELLIACHDPYPSTDVVFALAYRMLDPTMKDLIDYRWFKFIHNKADVHGLDRFANHNDYLLPNTSGEKMYVGETRVNRVWHYHDKELDVLNI
jgi:hypothetical protein